MPDVLWGLIWFQIVCKNNQQTTLVGKELTVSLRMNNTTSVTNEVLFVHVVIDFELKKVLPPPP